jgi:tetratricopeptide (TPR) repeat protein
MTRRVSYIITAVACTALFSLSVADETFDNMVAAGKYKEAIDYVDQKIPATSRTPDVWVKLADANEKIGLVEKALACYMVSWRMNPNDYASLLGSARIYNRLNQPDNAMNMASKALEQQFTSDASWEYARACIALRRPAEAKQALEKVIEGDPSNVVANRELGLIYFDDKAYSKAIALLQKSYDTKADSDVAYKIGKCYLETGNATAGTEYLKRAIDANPSMYQANLELARSYFALGKYAQATAEFERIASKVSLEASDYYNWATSLEETNRAGQAIVAYRGAVQRFGSSREKNAISSRYKVGKTDLDQKDYSSALTQFSFIVAADERAQNVKDIYFLLADTYAGMNNTTKARESLEKAILLDKTNIEAYARLADMYEKADMKDKARATYEAMMSLSPDDPNVYLVLGDYNLKASKYTDAMSLFVKSNGLAKSARALEGIAVCAAALNQWEKAKDAGESAILMDADLVDSRIALYKAYMRESNYREAKKHLDFLTQKKPGAIEYWQALAFCLDKIGDIEGLAAADQKVIALDYKNSDSRLRFAKYSLSRKDEETAYRLFKELSLLSPNNVEVFRNLYMLAKSKNDKISAVSYLQKYLSLNSNDGEAQRDLGDMLYERKDLDGSLAAYRKAIQVDPSIKGFYKRYAEIVIAKGEQDEVIKALSGVIKQGEADLSTYTTLGMIYQKKKMYTNARDVYLKALQLEPQNTDALIALGECYAQVGNFSDAVITYEQAVMMNPNASDEYKALGDLYQKQGKNEQAMNAYMKYLDKKPNDQEIAAKVGEFCYTSKNYKCAVTYLSLFKGGTDVQSFNLLLEYGESAYNINDYKTAISVFEGLRKRTAVKPLTMKGLLKMLAESYEKSDNLPLAVLVYSDYIKIPGANDADAAYKVAFLQEKTNPAVAQRAYENNVVSFPKDYRNYLQLGLIYSKSSATLSKAALMLEKATALANTVPSVWQEIGKVYRGMGNDEKELSAYNRFIQADPRNASDPEMSTRIGEILLKQGKYTDAIINLETANTLTPNNFRIMSALAQGYIKTNRSQEAGNLLEKAKALKKDDIELRQRLIEVYSKTGNNTKAIQEVKELIEMKRDNSYLLMYAKMLLTDGKLKDAEDAIENIRATDAENIEALMTLGLIQRAKKKYDEAIETYKEVSYIDPNNVPALYERAEVYMQQGKQQWALKFYERALRGDPKFGLAELGLAKISLLNKNKSEYQSHVQKAYQMDPKNPLIIEEYNKAWK